MGTKNSDLVSNFEATPQVKNSAGLLHGSVRVAQGTIVVAAGDSDDDDIVARQLREAAMAEEDPAIKELLWEPSRGGED